MSWAVLPRRKGLLHGPRPKGRAADAQHQHMLVGLDAGNQRGHFHFQLGAEGHGNKGQLAGCQLALKPLGHFRRARLQGRSRISVKAMSIRSRPFEQMRHGYLLWCCAAFLAAHYKSRKGLGAKKRRRTALYVCGRTPNRQCHRAQASRAAQARTSTLSPAQPMHCLRMARKA